MVEVCVTVSVGRAVSCHSAILILSSHTATVDDYERGEDIGVLRSKFQEATRDNDTTRTIVWAGAGVGLMKDVKPAKVSGVFHQMSNLLMIFCQ